MQPKPTIRESAVIGFNDTVGQTIEVVAGSLGTWRITYTAGPRGIAPGGGIKIFRTVHKFWLGMVKQTTDPKAEDYCYAAATGQCTVKLLDVPLFYKRLNIATIRVEGEPLKPGQSLSFVVGDSAKGTPLAEVPAYAQRNCGFEISVDYDGSGTFVKLSRPLVVNVVPGRPVRGAVVCPSVVAAGEEFNVKVRFEDKNCNPGAAFTGVALFESTDPDAKLPRPATFTRRNKGIRMFRDVRLNTPGVHRIVLRDSEGEMELRSNPIRCVDEKPRVRVFWGDMHNHTEWADGTGSIEDTYLFARDRAFLDICAVTEHFAGSEGFPIPVADKPLGDSAQFWPLAQRAVYDFYEPGTFVTLLGYEYTPRSGHGKVGDHCVYFLDPGHALVCDPSFGALVKRCAETDALIIPHVGGGWTDWQFEHFDEKVIRLVEVASMHEHSEWFAQEGLSRGFKLGIVGMSDGHIGCPGLDVWSRHGRTPNFKKRHFSVQSAITAVLAPDLTREAVWDALENRRVYATTGQRILLDFQMDGLGMGESYQTASPPKVKVEVNGMAKIDRVDLIRNQSLIHTHFGEDEDESFTFEDKFAPAGESYYYVRVTQSDSSFAWSSPIWVTFTGAPQKSETPEKAWNADPWPPAQTAQDVNYLSRVTAHIAQQTDAARLDLEQIGVFEEQRGSFVLFRGFDKARDNCPVHVHYYLGFEDDRIYISTGWADYGPMSNVIRGGQTRKTDGLKIGK